MLVTRLSMWRGQFSQFMKRYLKVKLQSDTICEFQVLSEGCTPLSYSTHNHIEKDYGLKVDSLHYISVCKGFSPNFASNFK